MTSNKGDFWEYLFAPLDFPDVPLCPGELHFDTWITHVQNFNGNIWVASRHLEYFMDYMVENNIVYENVFMKAFVFSMQGKDAWHWYYNLNPK
jgi:hypothetical protein